MDFETLERIRDFVTYDPDTGFFVWKTRTNEPYSPKIKTWNERFAGKIVGSARGDGYLSTRILGSTYKLHKLAIFMHNGSVTGEVDHINGIRSDNRLCNLRVVTRAENSKNKKLYSQSLTGIAGVGWHKVTQKWAAKIRVDHRDIHLGVFPTIVEASAARKAAEIKFGFHPNHGRS